LDRGNDPCAPSIGARNFGKRDYRQSVPICRRRLTEHTDSQTIIRIASSLERAGESGKRFRSLEKALENRIEDGRCTLHWRRYKSQGNLAKAAELEREARTHAGSKLN